MSDKSKTNNVSKGSQQYGDKIDNPAWVLESDNFSFIFSFLMTPYDLRCFPMLKCIVFSPFFTEFSRADTQK